MARSIILTPFEEEVRKALEMAHDVDKLGRMSPLAAPYLLAHYLDENDALAADRGKKLVILLEQAIGKISGQYSDRYKAILRGQYLEGLSIEKVVQIDGVHLSSASKATYHENRKIGISQLAAILTDLLAPAMRLEKPLQVTRKLFSREWEIQSCWQALQAAQTVILTGNGGVGKTTLASHLAGKWEPGNNFWFTIRPGSNDHVQSITFALGHFFKTLGDATLWQQMISQVKGMPLSDLDKVIRNSLQNLSRSDRKLLLCFDEVDRLDPAINHSHTDIINLLNALSHENIGLLFIGQQPLLESQQSFNLGDLALFVTSQVLEDAGFHLSPPEVQKVHHFTNGNPRLIDLVITLLSYGTSVSELQNEASYAAQLQFFLNKIFLRLNSEEADLMRLLSVFRDPAPIDLWQELTVSAKALGQLAEKRLLITDKHGGVSVLPAYREIIHSLLSTETRQLSHKFAAKIWTLHAAHTAAAYHMVQAGQEELAILHWTKYQQQEINQGQAYVAYELFHSLDRQTLSPQVREQNGLLCAELARLIGNDQQALIDIGSVAWKSPILSIKASIQDGIIHNDASEFAEARRKFNSALETANDVIGIQLAYIHKGLSWSHYKEGELQKAWLESQRAQHEVVFMQGVIQYELMKWDRAEYFFHTALSIAQEIGYQDGVANTANSLVALYSLLGKHEQVETYVNMATAVYNALGRHQLISRLKTNLALSYNLSGQHDRALQELTEAKEIVQSHQYQLPVQFEHYINLEFAEAYLGNGDWDTAEKFILPLTGQEETGFRADAYRIMGDIHSGRGELVTAMQWLNWAIELIEQDETPDLYIYAFTFRSRAIAYTKAGQPQNAIVDRKRAIEIFTEISLLHEVERTVALLPI